MKRKYLNLRKLTPVLVLGASCAVQAQVSTSLNLHNGGDIYVSPNEVLSIKGAFSNTKAATFINNGEVHFFDDFSNEGSFIFSKSTKASKVFFEQLEAAKAKRKISGGENTTFFEDVVFDTEGLDLTTEITIGGKALFERGHVVVNAPLSGAITFLDGSSIDKVSDDSHVVGFADREGKQEQVMPVGDGTYYRPIILGESKGAKDLFQTQYKYSNPLVGRAHSEKNAIVEINNAEYWEVNSKASDAGVILTLSWDEKTTPASLLLTPEKNLHILRWDASSSKWEDVGGIVDVSTKTVRTPMTINTNGIFTLGTVNGDYNAEIKIYNAVSPDGDGMNDYFIIENIDKYPNNSVQIVNRWGGKVYSTNNYDRNGDGSMNVFRGEAEGKGVSSSGKLPSGTYYYIVKYEVQTARGSEMITKTGYLHLENN
ncbi:gliding motility-associated C-terminal domain-containing protein [Myroides odoratimimus]|uniref:gliding motility-associated C-terminal domain-containing protein n=1 Tax=Myroides odoratimimus TaxID=76832 RepID=UPI0025780639|nr:gliding motility-associated C-terminal domain-containing protein [Myroides odoratimimus]